jgi:hypothetical protein
MSSDVPIIRITINATIEIAIPPSGISQLFTTSLKAALEKSADDLPQVNPDDLPSGPREAVADWQAAQTVEPSVPPRLTREQEDQLLAEAQAKVDAQRGDSANPPDELEARRRQSGMARALIESSPGAIDAAEQNGKWHCDIRRKMRLLELFAKLTVAPINYSEKQLRDWMDEEFGTRTRKNLENDEADLLIAHCSKLINAWIEEHPGEKLKSSKRADLKLAGAQLAVEGRKRAVGEHRHGELPAKTKRGASRQ